MPPESLDTLSAVLGWSLLLNLAFYAITCIAAVGMRDWICRLQGRMFGIDPAKLPMILFTYIAAYKILIIVFFFVPWIAIQIVR